MQMNDLEIVENIKNKDTSTLEYVIEKYSKQIYYLAYNILHISCTKEDIEECVSDVFAEVWLDINKFDPSKATFKTWLFMLTKYKALKYKRKITKQKTINIDNLIIKDIVDIEEQFITKEKQEKVINIIDKFNSIDKELFIRRYFFDEKIDALMNSFNLSRSAIDNRLLRCRKVIREECLYG